MEEQMALKRLCQLCGDWLFPSSEDRNFCALFALPGKYRALLEGLVAFKLKIWPCAWSVSVRTPCSVLRRNFKDSKLLNGVFSFFLCGTLPWQWQTAVLLKEPRVPGKELLTYSCLSLACNPLKCDEVAWTRMWLPGSWTGSKILPRNRNQLVAYGLAQLKH